MRTRIRGINTETFCQWYYQRIWAVCPTSPLYFPAHWTWLMNFNSFCFVGIELNVLSVWNWASQYGPKRAFLDVFWPKIVHTFVKCIEHDRNPKECVENHLEKTPATPIKEPKNNEEPNHALICEGIPHDVKPICSA